MQLQSCVLSNLLCFSRREVAARRYHGFQLCYQLWYLLDRRFLFIGILVCYLMASFTVIHFFYGRQRTLSWEHLKRSILSRVLCLLYKTNCSHPLYQADCGYLKKHLNGTVCIRGKQLSIVNCLFVPQN